MNNKRRQTHPNRQPAHVIGGLVFYLIIAGTSHTANAAVIDGREWRQPLDTVGFSYETIATACDVITGACSGSIQNNNGPFVDVTGWTWANATDVARFFETLTGEPVGEFGETTSFLDDGGAAWALAAIDTDRAGVDTGLFHFTGERTGDVNPTLYTVQGLTRSLVDANSANRAYFGDNGISSIAVIGNPVPTDAARVLNGAWLYKDVSEVPIPAAAWLFASAMMGLIVARKSSAR